MRQKLLAAGEACGAIFRPDQGLKERELQESQQTRNLISAPAVSYCGYDRSNGQKTVTLASSTTTRLRSETILTLS